MAISVRSTSGNLGDPNPTSPGQPASGSGANISQLSTLNAQIDSMREQSNKNSQISTLSIQNADEISAVQQSEYAAGNYTEQYFNSKIDAALLLGRADELKSKAESGTVSKSEAIALLQEAKRLRKEAEDMLAQAEQASANADAAMVETNDYSRVQNNTQNQLEETTSTVSTNSTLLGQFQQTASELLKNLGLS